jgi:hypothetical protein
MLSLPWSPYTTKYYSLWHNKFVSGCLKKTLLWNYFVWGDWNSVLCLQKIQSSLIQEALGEWHICQNSVNLTCIGLGRCQIIEYSGLSNGTYTDISSFSNFLLLLLQVVYSSNQKSNFINVLFTMDEIVQGIQENMILNWFLDK